MSLRVVQRWLLDQVMFTLLLQLHQPSIYTALIHIWRNHKYSINPEYCFQQIWPKWPFIEPSKVVIHKGGLLRCNYCELPFQLNLASSHKTFIFAKILFFLCPTNLSLVKLSKAFCSSLPPVHLSYLPPAVELKQNWSTEPDTFINRTSSQSSEKKHRTLSHTFKQSKYRLKMFTLLLDYF